MEKLAEKGTLGPGEISALREKYPHDDYIIEGYLNQAAKRHNTIRKYARKLANKVMTKYSDGSKTLHEIFDIMRKYKNDNKWTDFEFDEFRKELAYRLSGTPQVKLAYGQYNILNKSIINKTLGAPISWNMRVGDGLKIKDSEHGILSEIFSLYERYQSLHRSVIMLSLMYDDCSVAAMTGTFKRETHIATNHIHPVVACLFLPKFEILEYHMLYSNFGSIISTRYKRQPITNEPDALLFYDITSDPNDIVCEIKSPITDLRNRYKMQISLWETVLNLRNGRYYDDKSIGDFLATLHACRNNMYDNADSAYAQDEGSILKRLLNVFSLRPTIVSTKPINGVASFMATYSMGRPTNNLTISNGVFPFNSQPIATITSIPMINLQLPPYADATSAPIDITEALHQTIWINENKVIIPKEHSIIYSKEILIFYVNRRVQRIYIKTYANPISFSQLPLTMANFEKLNSYALYVPERLSIRSAEDTFLLRSVVALTETEIVQNGNKTSIITGSTGLIMTHRDISRNIFNQQYYLYDPFGASLPVEQPGGYITNKPISLINPYVTPFGSTTPSFADMASTKGTIFIYGKESGYNRNEVIQL